ncbi:hypothetical protein MMC26_006723 [Xylographa opegraphella]|nr:hypothetical protein [Xylographa opegraphella]
MTGSACPHRGTEHVQSHHPPSSASLFDVGRAKPLGAVYTRTLVAGRLKDQEKPWIEEEYPDLATTIYVVDDPSARYRVPANKGHEAMVYLTYIIDHYDNLLEAWLIKLKEREVSENEVASWLQGGAEAGIDGEYWSNRSKELEFELEKEKEEAFARGDDIRNRQIEESSESSRHH